MSHIEIIARIELFSGEKMRKEPFSSGYRPLFDFINAKTKISGSISLINGSFFEPGTIKDVRITFIKGIISDTHFASGNEFTFSEGASILGKGKILEVINTEE